MQFLKIRKLKKKIKRSMRFSIKKIEKWMNFLTHLIN